MKRPRPSRVEVDGVPAEADAALRRLESVQAQLRTLEHSEDSESRGARQKLLDELPELEQQTQRIRADMESRRGVVGAVRSLRAERSRERKDERARALSDQKFSRASARSSTRCCPSSKRAWPSAEELAKNARRAATPRVLQR